MNRLIIAAIASPSIITGAHAERYNPFGPEDPGYAKAMRDWGRGILFAKYSALLCPEYKVSYNELYFRNGPTDLWDHARFDKFMNAIMQETQYKMDAEQAVLGHEKYCKVTIEFITTNYKPDNRPGLSMANNRAYHEPLRMIGGPAYGFSFVMPGVGGFSTTD